MISEPQIKRHPTNMTLLVESKAVLPCVTLGNPKPDITWLKDDELIKVCALISTLIKTNTGALEGVQPLNVSFDAAAALRSVSASLFWITEP